MDEKTVPMVVSGIFRGSCLFTSNNVYSRRIKALSSAYAASNSAIQELGEKKTIKEVTVNG